MAMILPKGIVVNSPSAKNQIERIDREPLAWEEIARFWKVYTTTGRRLRDPTAERLENYWWRIWGSRKRELKGATVARLFAEISDGESFVPLRSPVDRDEGTPPSRRTRPGPGASMSSTALHNAQDSRPSTTSSSAASRALPPPILKKSRGPSTSGPRPTARFISPHDSEVETDQVSPNSHVVVQPPSPDSQHLRIERKAASGLAAGKKKAPAFVASTAANKKRPVIVRRPSSQTSQSSTDSASRAYESAQLLAENEASSQRTPPNPPVRKDSALEGIESQMRGRERAQSSKFQENFSPTTTVQSPKRRQQLSGKPASSKRLSPRKCTSETRRQLNGVPVDPDQEVTPLGEPGPSTRLQPIQNGQTPAEELSPEDREEIEVQKLLLEQANTNVPKTSRKLTPPTMSKSEVKVLHKSLRSSSDGNQREMGAIRLLPADVKSTVSLAPALPTMAGELPTEAPPKDFPRMVSKKLDKGKGRDPEELKRAEMFAKRPVQPISQGLSMASSGIATLSKSKSQLTLLLEKDRAHSAEHKKEEKKRERSKDDKKRDKK